MDRGRRVLIVDDDPNLRKTLADILRVKGYAPVVLSTGQAALREAGKEPPAVALIDLRLEDMTGLEVMQEITRCCPDTECIVLTGHASQASAIQAINLGAFSYIQKPYDVDQLLVILRRAIEKREAEAALRRSEASLARAQRIGRLGNWEWDVKREALSWSDEVYRIFGIARDFDLTPRSVETFVHPEDREIYRAELRAWLATADAGEHQLRIVRPDGAVRYLYQSVEVSRDEAGEVVRLFGVVQDVTEQVQAEAERERLLAQIQKQAGQVRQILDTVPEGVLLLDAERRILVANPVAEQILGVLAEARVGDTLSRLSDRPLEELLAPPPPGMWHEITAGSRTFEAIAQSLEAVGESPGWVLVLRDITQEREIQQRIQQQDRLAAVGQLAAGIAHDFNNIMAVIVLYTEIAVSATPDLSAKSLDRLKTVVQQARRASDLIQQILDFSRRAVIERQPLNLVPLLKEEAKLLRRTLPENIQVHLNPADQADGYVVLADPTRMQQMVMNMALNARDAMPEGGELHIGVERLQIDPGDRPPLPEMDLGQVDVWVRLTIRDTGTGIPHDARPHIFEPFFTTKPPGQGSGLGLAQVYGIVKQHDGEIGVQTKVGQGTTFTVYLPALAKGETALADVEMEPLAQGSGENILVVEDDAVTRSALVDTLEVLGYRALSAANGREALQLLERRAPEIALVLSDVIMPDMGGIALFQTLRQRHPQLRVLLLTGHPMEEALEGLRAQGLTDWLPKPPDIDTLAQAIARAL